MFSKDAQQWRTGLPEACKIPVKTTVRWSSRRGVRIPRTEFEITFTRSSGPGGQNVNKVSSKACLRWPVMQSPSLTDAVKNRFVAKYRRRITAAGDLLVTSQRTRDQARNLADCYDKLRTMIALVLKPPKTRKRHATHARLTRAPARKQAPARNASNTAVGRLIEAGIVNSGW